MAAQVELRKHILALSIAASDKLLTDVVLNIDSEESDDSDNIEEIQMELRRRINMRGREVKSSKIETYIKEIIPRFSDNQFREHFRMLPETYELLEQSLSNALSKQNNDGRPMIPVRKQLLTSLWLLATSDTYK